MHGGRGLEGLIGTTNEVGASRRMWVWAGGASKGGTPQNSSCIGVYHKWQEEDFKRTRTDACVVVVGVGEGCLIHRR